MAFSTPGPKLYFFHPDHLGSSTYLTDANGEPYQFFLNLPFGETMAERRNIYEDFETPYKFNGKELDPETGMYYYGARYYDPKLSIWMSVDPLAEKFPNASPYNYCMNNPVNMVDPDGKAPTDWFVNFKTGGVVFVPGQSKLTQSTANAIHAGDANNYKRLGPDNMFGNVVPYGTNANVLDDGPKNIDNPEKFMKNQGYVKAENVNIKEMEVTSGGRMGPGENISQTINTLEQKGDSQITLAKPEQLNTKSNVRTVSSSGTYSNIESTSYTLTKPYGEGNKNNSNYGSKATSANVMGVLGIMADVIEKAISK